MTIKNVKKLKNLIIFIIYTIQQNIINEYLQNLMAVREIFSIKVIIKKKSFPNFYAQETLS